MPIFASALHSSRAVAGSRGGRLVGRRTPGVYTSEPALEERAQARQAPGDDADVELDGGPDGNVARVPQPVAQLAVVGDVAELDKGSGAGEDAEAQHAEQRDARARVHVEPPQHGRRDDNGEQEVRQDVERRVRVREALEGGP